MVATLFVFPRLSLYVFIGSRAAALSDGEQRSYMDTHTKVLNGAVIVVGLLIALASGWFVYRLMQKHIRQQEAFSDETGHLVTDTPEDAEEDAPLLPAFSPEPCTEPTFSPDFNRFISE